MGVPAHWTGSSHVTQAAIKTSGSNAVAGRFHYASNGNESRFVIIGNQVGFHAIYSSGAELRSKMVPVPLIEPRPTAPGQTKIHSELGSSVLWNLKLKGWGWYLRWLNSSSPPRGSFWGREGSPGNYPATPAAQNSYNLKAIASPKIEGYSGDFANYTFAADGTVTDYFLWVALGGKTTKTGACPSFESSVYFGYFATPGDKQDQLMGWPSRHLSLVWGGDK